MTNSLIIFTILSISISLAKSEFCHNPNLFKCQTSNQCIPKRFFCDQGNDCIDGSDEPICCQNPQEYNPEGYFLCNDGERCIPKSWMDDGVIDCKDGSDEMVQISINDTVIGPFKEFEISANKFHAQWVATHSTITKFVQSMDDREYEYLSYLRGLLEPEPCFNCSKSFECEYLMYNSNDVLESYKYARNYRLNSITNWTKKMNYKLFKYESQVAILKNLASMKEMFCSMKPKNESCETAATDMINSEANREMAALSSEEQEFSKELLALPGLIEDIEQFETDIWNYAVELKSQYMCCQFSDKPYYNDFCSPETTLAT